MSFEARAFRHKCAACLILFVALASCARAVAQTNRESVLMPPTVQGLTPIQQPDTRGMEPEAREHIASAQKALAAATKDPATPPDKLGEAYGTMGQIYHAYSLHEAAKECYLNAARLSPKDFRWAYLLGKLYEREGDAAQAVRYYDAARTLRPDYLPVFVNLGNIYLQLNRLDEAEASFKQVIEKYEASAAAQYGLGQVSLSRRNYAEAVRYLEKALQLAPEANRLHYALAMAYRGLGEAGKAQSHLALSGSVGVRASDSLLDGLQELVRGARLHLARGRTALEARRFSEAAEEFRKAIGEQPDSIPAHFNLGAALTQTGDLRGAIEQFKEVIRLDPAHANAHYNLGILLAGDNQHEEAIKHLRTALDAQPGDNSARSLLTQELSKTGRLEEAEAESAKVVEADANDENALLGYVNILLARKQYGRALAALEKGHEQFPGKGLTVVTLAYLLAASPQAQLRDGTRALALAQSAYEASPTIDHGALVAMALAELGRCDEAAAWTRRMTARADAEGRADVAGRLKAQLGRYESERPCRPPLNVTLPGQAPAQ